MKYLSIMLLIILSSCSKSTYFNNLGSINLRFGDTVKADKNYNRSLNNDPHRWIARYNFAVTQMGLENLNDSLKELEVLEKEVSSAKSGVFRNEILFKIKFAKGFLYGLIKDIPKALDSYQEALGLKPNSYDVKKNIELLTSEKKGGGKGGESSEQSKDGEDGEASDSDNNTNDGESDKNEGKGDKKDKDPKGQDDSSLEKKQLSKEEIEQILKEIKEQESEVRSRENIRNNKKGEDNDKNW